LLSNLSQFNTLALSIQEAAQEHWKGVIDATVGISELVTAETATETWPFVTLRNWDLYIKTEASAVTDFIAVCPLVLPDELDAWVEYSASNTTVVSVAGGDRRLATVSQHYPFWKMFPWTQELATIDAYTVLQMQPLIDAATTSKRLVAGSIGAVGEDFFMQLKTTPTNDERSSTAATTTASSDPNHESTILVYPVFERLHDTSSKIVAISSSILNWRSFIEHLLPPGVYGVHYVLQDTCENARDDKTYTYVVKEDNLKATFLGIGDLHESKFDRYAYVIVYSDTNVGSHDNTPIRGGGANCSYVITVYPSSELQSQYSSTTPIIFYSVLAGLFLLMTAAFFVYDNFMRQTHDKIIRSAAKSNAFVSSMFPAGIHQRLFDSSATDLTSAGNNGNPENATTEADARRKGHSMRKVAGETDRGSDIDGNADKGMYNCKPIADLYPETTIMVRLLLLSHNSQPVFADPKYSHGFITFLKTPPRCAACGSSWIHSLEFCPGTFTGIHSIRNNLPSIRRNSGSEKNFQS
jgi:hypothetical protein